METKWRSNGDIGAEPLGHKRPPFPYGVVDEYQQPTRCTYIHKRKELNPQPQLGYSQPASQHSTPLNSIVDAEILML